MGHENVLKWKKNGGIGPRPCDWCGCSLTKGVQYIHQKCDNCDRQCFREEEKLYTRLGYDANTGDITLPPGYKIRIS